MDCVVYLLYYSFAWEYSYICWLSLLIRTVLYFPERMHHCDHLSVIFNHLLPMVVVVSLIWPDSNLSKRLVHSKPTLEHKNAI